MQIPIVHQRGTVLLLSAERKHVFLLVLLGLSVARGHVVVGDLLELFDHGGLAHNVLGRLDAPRKHPAHDVLHLHLPVVVLLAVDHEHQLVSRKRDLKVLGCSVAPRRHKQLLRQVVYRLGVGLVCAAHDR